MPKRTNQFQQLVYLIQRQLKDRADTVITESKMLRDRVSGDEREVDITVETTVHGVPYTLSFEVRKGSRRPALPWVEQLVAKHETLSDKLVLVANREFSKKALARAERAGAVTISMSEATTSDWPAFIDQYSVGLVFETFDITPAPSIFHYDRPNSAPELLETDQTILVETADGRRGPPLPPVPM